MKKGFTLIELLVVVLIIGILSAVAFPQYTKAVEKSRATEALILLKNIQDAALVCCLERECDDGGYDCLLEDLSISIPGLDMQSPYYVGKNFEYACDEGGCHSPYVWRINSEYDYGIQLVSHYHPYESIRNKRICMGDNPKGQEICRSLGGKELETVGNRITYEL